MSVKSARIWAFWLTLTALFASYLAYALVEGERGVFLIGDVTHGHHQLEMACTVCHQSPFGGRGVLQNACMQCHGDELEQADDSHPKSKFTDPRNFDRVQQLDARYCITCHTEHQPEQTHAMGVTLPTDFCVRCHADIGEERVSHRGLEFSSCATGGCHNFHDNQALYEDFLVKHAGEPEVLAVASVRQRDESALLEVLYEHPVEALERTDITAPPVFQTNSDIIEDWETTAHAHAGVGCRDCHTESPEQDGNLVWNEKPDQSVCMSCHETEAEGFVAGKHGMRIGEGLPPMRPELARLPMRNGAHGQALSCTSCHTSHRFDTRRAAVDACMSCHDDSHTRSYRQSPHFRLWQAESEGNAAAGSGVSCATCHMPRKELSHEGVTLVVAEHNQNANLRPNEKMLRSVCMNCHGLGFALDALADRELIEANFDDVPKEHVPSIDWAVRRINDNGDEEG